MKSCTCKQIMKTAKSKKKFTRLPKGTYQSPKNVSLDKYNYKDKRTKKDRKPYHDAWYKKNREAQIAYQRAWQKKYGKQYRKDNKERIKIVQCKWLLKNPNYYQNRYKETGR